MSGHSKWHKIQHKKAKNDSQRAAAFTKLCRAVTVAAQEGGGDPEMNFSLRLAIDKAKAANVPNDNIDRAVKRGTGELKDQAALVSATYEGFGPDGVAMIIEAVTDNKNRTVSDVKHALSKHGGSLGGPGSVQWQFEQLGVIRLRKETRDAIEDWDDFALELMDAGVSDIIESEYGVELRCPVTQFKTVLDVVQAHGIKDPDDSGLEWIAKEEIDVSEETGKKMEIIFDALDELDDVKNIYTNEK